MQRMGKLAAFINAQFSTKATTKQKSQGIQRNVCPFKAHKENVAHLKEKNKVL